MNNKTYPEMRPGTLIRIKPEWMDPGERDIPYMVLEDRGDRVVVQELREYSKQPLLGQWCWSKDWIYIMDDDLPDIAQQAFDKDLFN